MNLVLLRYGEISLKGQNKSFFIQSLKHNIRDKLMKEDENLQIKQEAGRLYLKSIVSEDGLINCLTKIPGIVSISPAHKIEADMEVFKEESLKAIKNISDESFKTFRITTRRTNKEFPLTSMEISREVGAHILRNTDSLTVDLKDPDYTIYFEVRKEGSFIYTRIIPGVGGLPVNSSGKGLLLLSGGIDSPVAGWLALKRGIQIEGLYFHSSPFVSERSKLKVIDLCKALKRFSTTIVLYIVSLTPILKVIRKEVPEKYSIIVMRRFMMRIAESIATKKNIPVLITGESIGQVASQTLDNLKAISSVIKLPVLRPLSGMDKTEIISLARKIDTYSISVRPYEDCCTLFIPKHPVLSPNIKDLNTMEKNLPIVELMKEAEKNMETIEF